MYCFFPKKHYTAFIHANTYLLTLIHQLNNVLTAESIFVSTALHQAPGACGSFISELFKAEHWPHGQLKPLFSKHHIHLPIGKEIHCFIQLHRTVPFSFGSCLANRTQKRNKLYIALQVHSVVQLCWTVIFLQQVFNSWHRRAWFSS